MWAAEPINGPVTAKEVTVKILEELVALAPQEDLVPAKSQPPTPGEQPKCLMSCSEEGTFQYLGSTGLRFHDATSAEAFETAVYEHVRAQEGWAERSIEHPSDEPEPLFVSSGGLVLSALRLDHRGKHTVSITVSSPCFEMPDDFQQSVDQY